MIPLVISLIIFFLGLYFISRSDKIEGFDSKNNARCPNILMKHDNRYHLYNSKLAKIPGVNPLTFDNLEEYTEFMRWQRSQGIRCPILYLQKSYDAQGESVFRVHKHNDGNAGEFQPGLPDIPITSYFPQPESKLVDANLDNNPPFNKNEYAGFDPKDQNIGLNTPLDKMFHAPNGETSPNPMDTTWGGRAFTEEQIDSGKFSEDNVYMRN